METFLVFYGYLSLAFGWGFYAVVFTTSVSALFFHLREKNLYKTAERYVRNMVTLGIINLIIALVFSSFATLKWVLNS